MVLDYIMNCIIYNGTVEKIYIINISDEINKEYNFADNKIKIINYSHKKELYENHTMKLIHLFSQYNTNVEYFILAYKRPI